MASLGGMYESSYMYSSQFMNTMNPPTFEKVRFLPPGYLLVIYASTKFIILITIVFDSYGIPSSINLSVNQIKA